jgi:DNA-binding response OmpR family regulator
MSEPTSGITVLVVDDEDIDLLMTAEVLKAHGYVVLSANGYSDGMAVFDLHRDAIQLLIADVVLPDGNGCALALSMRKQRPDLRVLFISYHVGADALRYYGLDPSSLHFLTKPFEETELLKRVVGVLTAAKPFPKLAQTLTSGG